MYAFRKEEKKQLALELTALKLRNKDLKEKLEDLLKKRDGYEQRIKGII